MFVRDTARREASCGTPCRTRVKKGVNMLTLTKQDSIVIAITLGLALGVPLAIPAFYDNFERDDRGSERASVTESQSGGAPRQTEGSW